MALEDQVLGRQFIDEFEDIGKPGTASGAHAKTDTLALAAPLEGALHVFGGGFGHADGHCNSLLVTSGLEQTLLLLVVANGGLDGVFGENGAVDLHRRQGRSSAMVVFLMVSASSRVLPFIHSVARELEAIAEPQP